MYPNRSTCRQIQDFVAGYKIHVARYKIHAGYMLPATCIRQHVAGVYRAANKNVLRWRLNVCVERNCLRSAGYP